MLFKLEITLFHLLQESLNLIMKSFLLLLVLVIALLSLNSAPVEDEIALYGLEERAGGCTYAGICTENEDCCGQRTCECNIFLKDCYCRGPKFWATVRG
ncbi:teretoxin Tsu15.4-like [Stegodyphus dumicola]|uniref:teretoxin Tsu15.4-like n=1 Tax=Stegodyphus dumicola TaxID=202533 RepID=UPI0015A8367C|nr:teretoxin Tsu15.4-like [Stegodyphus dumicola]